jgi:type IV secretion/conjugal transfer VirB4 family ATPase
MNLAEYRARPAALADYLPWAGLIAPGVVLNKDGSFQRSARFRGPDLDSSTEHELVGATARINNALKRLGSGWAIFIEAERYPASDYPQSEFPDGLSRLIDEERRAAFEEVGAHFESIYHLTLLFLPPPETRARAGQWLFESTREQSVDWTEHLAGFVTESDRFLSLLDAVLPEIRWLNDEETLTYLHGTVSTQRHPVAVPETPFPLDGLLIDQPLTGGLAPMLGNAHVRAVSVRGFPTSTSPGVLDDLNRLGFAYRWCTRFLFLDKAEAERELKKVRRQWFAKRKGIVTLLRETIFQTESPLIDNDATNKAADADAALQELGSDAVAYGYVTSTVIVIDSDAAQADEKRQAIERAIQNRGFIAIAESFNATEAFLGSLPGQAYANVRQSPISTINLAHLMPVSAVWAGPAWNEHLKGPPLMMTRTDGATPFRLNLHIGDVGHTMVVGPTGAGKSVLLATLILQFLRYSNARVFAFDKGRSVRATVLGLDGQFYDLGAQGSIAFQPLSQLSDEAELTWAADWIGSRVRHEGIEITPDIKDSIWSALVSLSAAPTPERTLTGYCALLQSNRLRQALAPYTLSGPHGRLLDADEDRLGLSRIQGFEMEELMHTPSAVLPVLTYLFHKLEQWFDGSPTLLVLDEAWVYLDDPTFASRLREWLKTLRKLNVSVIFATQSLADVQRSSIAPALIESCPSRIFLPSPQATEPQLKPIYEGFGLNARQIDIVAHAIPKRHYYYQSRLGNRLFELGLGPVALAFVAASRPEDQRDIDELVQTLKPEAFAPKWLRRRGLDWAADLYRQFSRMHHTGDPS